MADTHNMSDDEFLAGGDDLLPEEEVIIEDEAEDEEIEDEDEGTEEDLEDTEDDTEDDEVIDTEEQTDDDALDPDEKEDEVEDDESQKADDEEDKETEEEATDGDTQKPTYKELESFYAEVTGDYKANGKTMPGFKDPADFKRALEMASGFAQKTTAIKPHMKRIKMLKDVTDAELNEMMDFRNRDPELIKKALLEAKIDLDDIDVDQEIKYTAKDHTVSDAEVEFDDVLDEIRDTQTFAKTTEVVTKVWDEKSKQAMINSPQLIAALNQEMEMGRYDEIQGLIDQNRLLGKGKEMTDLEMYQAIATAKNRELAEAEAEPVEDVVEVKPKVEDPAIKANKQKAGIKRQKIVTKKKNKYDPAQLSDEEFAKLMDDGATFV